MHNISFKQICNTAILRGCALTGKTFAKISQHGTAKTYRFVPVQDFSQAWTDAELYTKYNIDESEISFIE